MLKWLVNVAGQDGDLAADTDIHNKITEDPLATIKIGKKKKTDKVYSVNRFNPLYEEAGAAGERDKGCDQDQETVSTSSSGYGSHSTQKEAACRPPEQSSSIEVNVRRVEAEAEVPSPVWPQVHIAAPGHQPAPAPDHVTRIQVDTEAGAGPGAGLGAGPDSIVTHSLLVMMGAQASSTETDSSSVLELSEPVSSGQGARNKHAAAVTKAIKSARRSFRNVKGSLRQSGRRRPKIRRGRPGSLRSGGSVEAVRELWSRTGMRTNGRKLLLDPSSSEHETGGRGRGAANPGYESDEGSQVSVPRGSGVGGPGVPRPARRQESTSSSGSDTATRRQHARHKPRRHADSAVVHFDKIQVDRVDSFSKEAAGSKQVRFNNLHTRNPDVRSGLPRVRDRDMLWDKYYSAADPGMLEAGLHTLASNFTLDLARNKSLKRAEKRRKNIRCCCKISCFLILLISFLLVIITVTFFLTKGKKYFGAL